MGSGSNFMDTRSPGLLPAAAVKFLRSGTSSANWVLSNTLNPLPDGNHDMFSVPLQNHLPEKVDNTMAIGKFCSTGTVYWSKVIREKSRGGRFLWIRN